MLKVGQKASHYLSTHRVGTIVKIENIQNNILTFGGTTSAMIVVSIKYPDNTIVKYYSGDITRHYD